MWIGEVRKKRDWENLLDDYIINGDRRELLGECVDQKD